MTSFSTLEAHAHAWLRQHVDKYDDDAVPTSDNSCMNVDAHIEGVHFFANPSIADWTWIARRALLASVSDIYAQGASPTECLLSLAWPRHYDEGHIVALLQGFRSACEEFGVLWRGGNISQSTNCQLHVTALGQHHGPNRQRSADAGMGAYVVSALGDAVIARLSTGTQSTSKDPYRYPALLDDVYRAISKIPQNVGLTDITDGLAQEITTIARRSDIGAIVDVEAIPRSPHYAATIDQILETNPNRELQQELMWGGDEYTPLICLHEAEARNLAMAIEKQGHTLYAVGRFVHGQGLHCYGEFPTWYDNS